MPDASYSLFERRQAEVAGGVVLKVLRIFVKGLSERPRFRVRDRHPNGRRREAASGALAPRARRSLACE
jgi:hypothetical protein